MKLAVVIVNYNVKYYLHQCLYSVERAMRGIDGQIYVVDNCSTDDSINFLRPLHPDVCFIANTENVGFSRANNLAIRRSQSDYVLLLNPDTLIGENVLRRCVAFMEQHKNVGGMGVRMLKADGTFALESRRGIPTPFTSFCKLSGLCKLFPRNKTFGNYYMRYLDERMPNEIEIISGACMFLRRSALDVCGLLDEDFFMYGEDIDLSYRILQGGFKNYYLPVSILHYKGESTQKHSMRYVNAFHEAMLIFFRKHFSNLNIFISLPIRIAIYAKAFVYFCQIQVSKHFTPAKELIQNVRPKRYRVMGSTADFNLVAALLERYEVDVTRDDVDDADYVVFNAENRQFTDMLERMEQLSAQKNHAQLATFYPSLGMIITPDRILGLS